MWNGFHFEATSLKNIGLVIRLGHRLGEHCINPKPSPGDGFVIIDTYGVHDVALAFCGCANAQSNTTQLLRAGLFPATTQHPETAATFNTLEYFHMLTFESKASAFEYFNTISRLTDNTGTVDVPVGHSVQVMLPSVTNIEYRIAILNFSG